MKKKLKTLFSNAGMIALMVLFLSSQERESNSLIDQYLIDAESFILTIDKRTFSFSFLNKKNKVLAPMHEKSGIMLSGHPITDSYEIDTLLEDQLQRFFYVKSETGESAKVSIKVDKHIASFKITPRENKYTGISIRLGSMPVAHGLGDAGSYGESFNLIENREDTYPIINNGGTKRWVSSFAIFPRNNVAGVCLDKSKKEVIINKKEYSMHTIKYGAANFYYFIGEPKQIYSSFKKVRNQNGFIESKPKYRLFQLGWESWDALGWNTNQTTVQNILTKFLENDYPIKWAITGSGFWEKGGTTTSFGKWGDKFSSPVTFKAWMHENDIKWMIGLRTNFVPSKGPFYPITKERDRNLQAQYFNGNNLSEEGLSKGYFLRDKLGDALGMTSSVFPIVPSYLLNGNAPGASEWFQFQYDKWRVDGIKEDTMMETDSTTSIYNNPVLEIGKRGGLVMARNGEIVSPGTLLRINDTHVSQLGSRIPINYFQYAASGFPNVYSDVVGVHNMGNLNETSSNLRHAWLLSLTSGIALGAYPNKWKETDIAVLKKALRFHQSLVPYLYSCAMEGYYTGFPVTLTPLTIAFPNDKNVESLDNFQWMIGESILAVPLLKNHESGKMDVYLPDGIWYDYENGERFQGPILLSEVNVPLDKIPCFIGGDGIIVLRKEERLIVKIYPVKKNVDYKFFDEVNDQYSTINVNNPNWEKLIITDLSDDEQVTFTEEKNCYIFNLKLGHHYSIE